MKICEQYSEILNPITEEAMLGQIELAARNCYKSEDKITEYSAPILVSKLIASGHDAMLEHASVTVRFVTDRGITHEIVRHRMASYAQESTRYCTYTKDSFGNEITVIQPYGIEEGSREYICWKRACSVAEEEYINLVLYGCPAQIARSVLPNSLKSELIMTANIREWRHFFKLRTDKAAHPQMRTLATNLLYQFCEFYPTLFIDLVPEECTLCKVN